MLVALPMLALFAVCVRWPVGPLRRIRQFTDQIIVPLFPSQARELGECLIELSEGWDENETGDLN